MARTQPEELARLRAHLAGKGAVAPAPPPAAAGATSASPVPTAAPALHAQGIVPVVAHLEAELATAADDERTELLASLGLAEPALAPVARLAYRALGLQSFYTAGEKEARAWPIRIGATAVQAARAIHSDIERGFIRAEVFGVARAMFSARATLYTSSSTSSHLMIACMHCTDDAGASGRRRQGRTADRAPGAPH